MEYVGKTDWELQDIVMPVDMNRIEQGIIDADTELANVPINAFTEVVGDLYTGDLDSVKAGVTSCADTATNLPLAEAGKCICINSGNYDTQLYIPRSGNYIYSRNNNGSVWTTWVRVANKSDLDLKANKSIIALEFSASTPYSYGNRCIYNEVVYKYTNATTTTGAWNASYWTAEPVGTSLNNTEYKTNYVVINHTSPSSVNINTLPTGLYHLNAVTNNPGPPIGEAIGPNNPCTVYTQGDGTYKIQKVFYDTTTADTRLAGTVWERVAIAGIWQAWKCTSAKAFSGTCTNLLTGGYVVWTINNNEITIEVNNYYAGGLAANTEYGIATLPITPAINSSDIFITVSSSSTTGALNAVAANSVLRLTPYVTIPANTYIKGTLKYFI